LPHGPTSRCRQTRTLARTDPSLAAVATTIREFCERHQVSEASFFSWRRVLKQRGLLNQTPAHGEPAPFVKLTVAASESVGAVEIVLGKRVLRVRSGFDAKLLLELLRLLEEQAC
jgi:hypothetical protein